MRPAPQISVAIPVYNEESVIPELIDRVTSVLDQLEGGPHELVLVDDCSTDATPELICEAALLDERIVAVYLSRNFGQQAAYGAAFEVADGDVVVLMDGDLQDSPEAIPEFVAAYRDGYDVVFAKRENRKEGRLKRFCYAAFYWLIGKLSDVDLPADAGDFGLLSRRVVGVLKQLPERHRYWRGLRRWVGFQQTCIPVEREARHSGEPKYSLRKLLKLAFDGIFSFTIFPLRLATVVGVLAVTLSVAFTAWAIVARLVWSQSPQGFTALLTGVTFLSGLQLFFLGIIGEYVGRIYEQVKQRPHFIISNITRKPCSLVTHSSTSSSTSDTGGGGPEKTISSTTSRVGILATMDTYLTSDAATDSS